MKKSILMITPENKEINAFRRKQFNNFIQITMPYLAGFIDQSKYEITLVDEYNQIKNICFFILDLPLTWSLYLHGFCP